MILHAEDAAVAHALVGWDVGRRDKEPVHRGNGLVVLGVPGSRALRKDRDQLAREQEGRPRSLGVAHVPGLFVQEGVDGRGCGGRAGTRVAKERVVGVEVLAPVLNGARQVGCSLFAGGADIG